MRDVQASALTAVVHHTLKTEYEAALAIAQTMPENAFWTEVRGQLMHYLGLNPFHAMRTPLTGPSNWHETNERMMALYHSTTSKKTKVLALGAIFGYDTSPQVADLMEGPYNFRNAREMIASL